VIPSIRTTYLLPLFGFQADDPLQQSWIDHFQSGLCSPVAEKLPATLAKLTGNLRAMVFFDPLIAKVKTGVGQGMHP